MAERIPPRALRPQLYEPWCRSGLWEKAETLAPGAGQRPHVGHLVPLPDLGSQHWGQELHGAPYLVIGVADCEVAHTDDDLVEQAFTGGPAAVAQEGAGDVPERQGQALGP